MPFRITEFLLIKMNKALFLLFVCSTGFAVPANDGRIERAQCISSFLRPGAIGAEIGVENGIFSYYVLLPKTPEKLYLIDPWQYGLGYSDGVTYFDGQEARDLRYQQVVECFAPYKNVEVLRMKSHDAAALFPDGYFDYVYIDGEHSYLGVWSDLTDYYPKVKPGGLIMGDDYGWTGVAPAVQDFVNLHAGECLFINDPYQSAGQYVIRKLK